MCSVKVHDWLVTLTMEMYWDVFMERGYVSVAHCQQIMYSDLIMLGIDNPHHLKLLLDGVQLLINSPHLFECQEPCELHAAGEEQSMDQWITEPEKVVPGFSPASSEGESEISKEFTKPRKPREPKVMPMGKHTQKDKAPAANLKNDCFTFALPLHT